MESVLTERFTAATAMALRVHRDDLRKGTKIPYVAHLLSVSALVLEHGGTEDQAIAALLHDAAEDHGGQTVVDEIRDMFGDVVADIVLACSDSLVEDPEGKAAWWPRKVGYLDHLADAPADALLVSVADKLHNARAILADYRKLGDRLWRRFNKAAGRGGSLWYYSRLVEIYAARFPARSSAVALLDELRRTVTAICDHATSCGHDVTAELGSARRREAETRAELPRANEPVSYEQHVRLYVEAELGIPLEESSVPPSAERDQLRAEAARWIKNARRKGIEYDLPFE